MGNWRDGIRFLSRTTFNLVESDIIITEMDSGGNRYVVEDA